MSEVFIEGAEGVDLNIFSPVEAPIEELLPVARTKGYWVVEMSQVEDDIACHQVIELDENGNYKSGVSLFTQPLSSSNRSTWVAKVEMETFNRLFIEGTVG